MQRIQYSALILSLIAAPALQAHDFNAQNFYLSLQGGASFSMNADMEVTVGANSATDWDPAPEGYNNNLGTAAVWGGSLGYRITPLVFTEIEVTARDTYEYQKEQTGANPKTRYFDLKNTSVMAVLSLQGNGLSTPFSYKNGSFMMDPFLKVGLGVAFNEVTDFHSVHPNGTVSAVMPDQTESAFVWQAGAGLNFHAGDHFMASVGYRYVDAGNFESNNTITDMTPPLRISPWEGTLKANEVYLALTYLWAS